MKHFKLALILGLSLGAFAQAKSTEAFKMITSKDLMTLMQDKKATVYVVDANDAKTRKQWGTVPGAHLLDNYRTYNTAKELPTDKTTKLVFYCANEQCGASHAAATKAMSKGYKDVSVMKDGIMGWDKLTSAKPASAATGT